MTSISKSVYIDKLYDIVNKYNKENNNKDSKFQVDDNERISKHNNIFAKEYTPNWFEQVFVVKKVKNTGLWTYVINDFNGEEIIGTFYEK